MYWQPIVLWCLGLFVTPSLTYSLQQCVLHRTPFATTCPIQESPVTVDQSSALFPQTSDLDYVVNHDTDSNNPSIGQLSDEQHQISSSPHHHHDHNNNNNMVIYDSSPLPPPPPSASSSSPLVLPPTVPSGSATASTSPVSTAIAKRRVTIPSFEEWKKRIRQNEETDDNNRKPKRKSSRGTTNQGRDTIDSVDGGFSDDVGSVFETGDPNGPVSTAENTYEEGEYIAPQQQQQKQQSNKKHFAQVPLKSLKERFNYAWTICAATVRDVNKEARGAQSILFESKDQYLLNKCAADKFVIINLCEEILIDTIVLANFEFFSSTFKDFRVYVANTYPTKEWQLLGQWQARNTRDLQVFKVQDSIGWFEYMKIEFLTHYGNEYYCPLSLVRVHGMPMMEYWNAVESQGLSGDGGGETESLSDQHLWPADVRDDIIHPQLVTNTSEWFPSKGDTDLDNDDDTDNNPSSGQQQQINTGDNGKTASVILPMDDLEHESQQPYSETTDSIVNDDHQQQPSSVEKSDHPSSSSATNTMEAQPDGDMWNGNMSSPIILPTTTTTTPEQLDGKNNVKQNNDTIQVESETLSTSTSIINKPDGASATESLGTNTTTHSLDITSLNDNSDTNTTSSSIDLQSPSLTFIADDNNSTSTGTISLTTESPTWSPGNDTATIQSDNAPSSMTTATTITASPSASVTSTTKTHESPHINNDDTRHKSTHNKEPATQESIYKIIMKRLNALEANATLSQRYLDEQNNMLNDVFGEMEKRHQDQLIFVLDRLNETASNRIDGMKRRYEQSYAELKHQMESDMREMTAKISILTDQISFEKRVSMVQLAIVVTLFVFLALSRGTMSTLSPVMIAQAEERKRRQSDTTSTKSTSSSSGDGGTTNQRREPSSSLASMTKNKLDRSKLSLSSSNKIKLDMDGRKAASLDALKLHLAQQADLLPKLPSRLPSFSQSQLPEPTVDPSASIDSTASSSSSTETAIKASGTTTTTSTTTTDTLHHHHHQPEQRKNRRSISLNDITNDNRLESTTTTLTHHGKIDNSTLRENNNDHNNNNRLIDDHRASGLHHFGPTALDDDREDGNKSLTKTTKNRNYGDDDNNNSANDDITKEVSAKSNMSSPSSTETRLTTEDNAPLVPLKDENKENVDPLSVEFEQQQQQQQQQQRENHRTITNINNTTD